ncbi:MAG: sulfatase-like hydrolase/transferase, partial [Planctomycetes bacterium]|nr:sulfatase-like hydrolase/transferase [Planctomycetota bacterium]
FEECYKVMGSGGHSYFDLGGDSEGKFMHPIYRNKDRIDDEGYLTDRLSEEAVAFIERSKHKPFFLYLAYNAVHAPPEAPDDTIAEYRKRFPGITEERVILMAMLKHLDDGVGQVVAKLKNEGLFDNTLLFFLTDNGGARAMSADNTPLRGYKGSLEEGGIRTPFIVSWPAMFPGKRTIDTPIISLDILPTALDAIGVEPPDAPAFDGKSLLPLLTGESTTHHDTLFWCKDGGEWAVRRGDWKLRVARGQRELFNLSDDPSEQANRVGQHAEIEKALDAAFRSWFAQMADPITGGNRKPKAEPAKGESTERKQERARK